jgi:hypothetical protein
MDATCGLRLAVVALDGSAAMAPYADAAREQADRFIAAQAAFPSGLVMASVIGSEEVELFGPMPAREVLPIPAADFRPSGPSRFCERFGDMLLRVDHHVRVSGRPPDRIIVLACSLLGPDDSVGFSRAQLATLIRNRTDRYGWQFTFWGAEPYGALGLDRHSQS